MTTVLAPDESSEAILRLEMSSDVEITAFLSWELSSPACEAHKLFSNTGVPHLFVNVISANNARYCDEESASGGHFLYRTFLKISAEYAPILQEGSNFCKKTAKKFILPPKFQKVRFEMQKKFANF